MVFQFSNYSIIFIAGMVLTQILFWVVWNRRSAPGAVPFAFLNTALLFWSFTWLMETSSIDVFQKILWAKMESIGIIGSGLLWLAFTLEYSGINWRHKPRYWLLVSIIPLITLGLVYTNEWHGWFWSDIYFRDSIKGLVTVWEHGFWFWIFSAYELLLILTGVIILWKFGNRRSTNFRKQAIVLTTSAAFPFIICGIYLLNIESLEGVDITSLILAFFGFMSTLLIFRYHFLEMPNLTHGQLAESFPDGLLVMDNLGRIADINPAAEKLTGIRKSNTSGQSLSRECPRLSRIIEGMNSGQHAEMAIEVAGQNVYIDISLTQLFNHQGSISGKLIVLHNITESKLIQEKLAGLYNEEHRLRHNLQDEMESRSQYTRTIVHELNTPLTAILSSSELLEELSLDKLPSSLVQNIRRASANLEQRTAELRELARGELGLLKVHPAPLNIARLLDQIMSEMTPVATSKGLQLISNIPEKLPMVMGDESRIRQVVLNLLNNAFKFTIQGQVTIRICNDSDSLLIQIEDTGVGMDKDQLDHLFTPYRLKPANASKEAGLGIGLVLSKVFVELHQGRIWVESQPGKGTVVSFTLPVAKGENGETWDSEPARNMTGGRLPGATLH